jgi:hypothetical protein
MSRSRTLLILWVIAVLAEFLLPPQTSTAQAESPLLSDVRTALLLRRAEALSECTSRRWAHECNGDFSPIIHPQQRIQIHRFT